MLRCVTKPSLYRCVSTDAVKKTCLYDFHVQKGGKMVDFAGYLMPVQYSNLGQIQSHTHTRKVCSIFDVSHMLQSEIRGNDCVEFIESLVVGDIANLRNGQGTLTVFTNDNGGIIDDLIVSKIDTDSLYVVSNAGCRHKDIPLMENAAKEFAAKGKDVSFVPRDDLALLAIQGPATRRIVQPLVNIDMARLYFMNTTSMTICGVKNARITRCGYTGEDGVEISVPADKAVTVANALLGSTIAKVEMAGLGARDSLRLEAGLCLYGNDMDENTTPVEAGLSWLIGKARKERGDFPGASKILEQLKDKTKVGKRRVGITSREGPPPRSQMAIMDGSNQVGEITSGCPSPTLGYNVAMGYVDSNVPIGANVQIQVRNKLVNGQISKMPFLKGKYYMLPKK